MQPWSHARKHMSLVCGQTRMRGQGEGVSPSFVHKASNPSVGDHAHFWPFEPFHQMLPELGLALGKTCKGSIVARCSHPIMFRH